MGFIFSKLIDIIPLCRYYPTQNINRLHEKVVKEWEDLLRLQVVEHLRCGDIGCWNIRWEVQAQKGTSHKGLMDNVSIMKSMPMTYQQWTTMHRQKKGCIILI